MRCLAAETWVVPGSASPLVGGALFWGGWLHCPVLTDLLLTCCCVGLIPDTAGFRVQGVLIQVFSFSFGNPAPMESQVFCWPASGWAWT